jgi:hypothetical protein
VKRTAVALTALALLAVGCEYEETSEADKGGTPRSEQKAETPSETQRVARKVAREFHANFGLGGDAEPSWYGVVTGFSDDLDSWDGSIEVRTDLYPDAEGKAFAADVGSGVLAVAFPLGVCKVDVVGSDGSRLIEHESHGAGC